jgi:peptidoglycan/LPS O-acetylase OafA/YrhL
MVIFSHSYPLSGAKTLEPLVSVTDGMESFGTVAVDLFFLISGMLITASWLRSNSMKDFLMKRVLRIYPGFVVAMVLTVVTIWIVCPEFRIGAEQGIVWLRTFFTDLVSLNNHSLIRNGIFSGNPFPNYGNESLWTIQKEFACYLLVAMLGLFCLFKQRGLILTATLAIYLISHLSRLKS